MTPDAPTPTTAPAAAIGPTGARVAAVLLACAAPFVVARLAVRPSSAPRPPGGTERPAAAMFDPFPDHEEVLLKGSKWGYINPAGKVVIEPQFERAGPFCGGRAAVRVDGRWGYIGPDGKVAIDPKYLDAHPFSEGCAAVKVAKGWAYIDARGTGLTPPDFEAADPFHEGMARVKAAGQYGFVDATGATVIPPQFAWAGQFGEGVAPVRAAENGQMVYVDRAGKVVLDPSAETALPFREGRAAVEVGGKWGFIDRTGRQVVLPQYDGVDYFGGFRGGLCRVQRDRKWGFIDRTGAVVIPIKYWEVADFSEGLARVSEKNDETGDWGYVDATGRLVFANKRSYGQCLGGLIRMQVDEGHVFLDRTGKQVIDKVERAEDFSDGLAAFGVHLNYDEVRQRWEQIRKNGGLGF